jgi:hypothetical protein
MSLHPASRQKIDPRLILALIIVLALALRVVAAAFLPDQTAAVPDSIGYREAGRELWSTGFMQTPLYMPLYPAVAGLFGPGWGQTAADIVLSVAAVWFVYEISMALFADTAAALLAAFGLAIYPQLIYMAVVGLSETLFIALLLGAYVCWYRGWFVAAAVIAVLSILTRPAVDLLAPILVVYFAFAIHRMSLRATARQLLIYAGIYCVLMAPWWLDQYHFRGTFVRLDLAAGENFYSGNNAMNRFGGGDVGADYERLFDNIADPVARDRAYWDAGLKYMKENPERVLRLDVTKFLRFWRLWPYAEVYAKPLYVVVSLLSFVPVLIMTLVYLALWGRSEFIRIAPLLAFAGYLTLVNVVFVASMRYRLPIEPMMIVLAAVAVVRLWRLTPLGRIWPAPVAAG